MRMHIDEPLYISSMHRHVYTYMSTQPHTHAYAYSQFTEDLALLPAKAYFLWVKDDGFCCPREPSLLPLTPAFAGSWALGTGTATRTLGPCCYKASGNPSTGLPPGLLHPRTTSSVSVVQVPALLHLQCESSEGDSRYNGQREALFSARLHALLEGSSPLLPSHSPFSLTKSQAITLLFYPCSLICAVTYSLLGHISFLYHFILSMDHCYF